MNEAERANVKHIAKWDTTSWDNLYNWDGDITIKGEFIKPENGDGMMEKHFRIYKRIIDRMSHGEQNALYKRYIADAIISAESLLQLEDETDIVLRISTTKRVCPENYGYCDEIDFGVEIEAIKPFTPKCYKKSKEEILIELKILIMTYINDLRRDFAELDKPMKSENSWNHIKAFIDDTFYS
jgi:hypothetical protein